MRPLAALTSALRTLALPTFALVCAAGVPALGQTDTGQAGAGRAYTGDEKSCVFASMERLPKVPNLAIRAVTVADYRKGDGGPGKPAGSALNDPKTVTITVGVPDVPALDTKFSFICGSSDIGGVSNTVSIPNGKPK